MPITLAQWAQALEQTEADLLEVAPVEAETEVHKAAIEWVNVAQDLVFNLLAAGAT